MANFRWMENEGALAEERHDFLNHPDDFISLSRHNDRRFEDFIESWLDRQGPDFFMKVCPRRTPDITDTNVPIAYPKDP